MKKKIAASAICLILIMTLLCALTACSLFYSGTPQRTPYYIDIAQVEDAGVASIVANNNIASCVRVLTTFRNQVRPSAATGFFVSEDGYVVTNRHCVVKFASTGTDLPSSNTPDEKPQSVKKYEIVTADNYVYSAELVTYSLTVDIAVLKIKNTVIDSIVGAPKTFDPVTFDSQDELFYGDRLYTIGNPNNMGLIFAELSVGSPAIKLSYSDKHNTIILDGNTNHGNSGGPLINCQSNVVGLIFARITTASTDFKEEIYGLGCALPAQVVTEFLKNNNIPFNEYQPAPAPSGDAQQQ